MEYIKHFDNTRRICVGEVNDDLKNMKRKRVLESIHTKHIIFCMCSKCFTSSKVIATPSNVFHIELDKIFDNHWLPSKFSLLPSEIYIYPYTYGISCVNLNIRRVCSVGGVVYSYPLTWSPLASSQD